MRNRFAQINEKWQKPWGEQRNANLKAQRKRVFPKVIYVCFYLFNFEMKSYWVALTGPELTYVDQAGLLTDIWLPLPPKC